MEPEPTPPPSQPEMEEEEPRIGQLRVVVRPPSLVPPLSPALAANAGEGDTAQAPESPSRSTSRTMRQTARTFIAGYYRDLNAAPSRVHRYYTVRECIRKLFSPLLQFVCPNSHYFEVLVRRPSCTMRSNTAPPLFALARSCLFMRFEGREEVGGS